MLRFRAGEPLASATEAEESNHADEVLAIKGKLMLKLRAYESVIFYFQQLFVWEKPAHSAVFVLLLHAGFWYLKVWTTHAIGLLASVMLLLVWVDMWKHRIWPEIRAQAPDPEASEWGELHPRLLSLPELCLMLAESLVNVHSYLKIIYNFRKESPGKFTVAATVCCILTIIVGRSIPGTLLAYAIMVTCLLWPLIWYRRWMERAYTQMEPLLMQLQYSLKPRMRRTGKKSTHITKEIDGTSVEVHTDSSSDDDDISEFMKPLDAVTAEVLARALTDDDELSESDESLLAHELPSFSHPSSTDGDKGSFAPPEVPIPPTPPQYEDPKFAEVADASDYDDEDIGLPSKMKETVQQMPELAQQMMVTATANAMTNVLKRTLDGALGSMSSNSPDINEDAVTDGASKRSTPSDDGFVVLRAEDIDE